MDIVLTINDETYRAGLGRAMDISIPVDFGKGSQLSVFGAPKAEKEIYKAGDFTGSVAAGGSCNCSIYKFIPHCHGTHTESVGHLTGSEIPVHDTLKDTLLSAALMTVTPEKAEGCGESYNESLLPDDLVITRHALEAMPVMRDVKALIIRTLPNEKSKRTRNYNESMPPYFTVEAMEYIATSGFKHLLVDLPSVDRLDDGGKLTAHRIFWGLAPDDTEVEPSAKTITELIYVPDEIENGLYILNLQIAPFMADAAPSRPVLYEVVPA